MNPPTIILRKELNGYPNYGGEGAADVVYEGEAETWTFQVPNVPIASAVLAMSISADDHYDYPLDAYHCEIWGGSACLFADQVPANHGQPFSSIFNDWMESDFPVTVTAGSSFTVTMHNTSTTGGPVHFNYIVTDWIELRIALQ